MEWALKSRELKFKEQFQKHSAQAGEERLFSRVTLSQADQAAEDSRPGEVGLRSRKSRRADGQQNWTQTLHRQVTE